MNKRSDDEARLVLTPLEAVLRRAIDLHKDDAAYLRALRGELRTMNAGAPTGGPEHLVLEVCLREVDAAIEWAGGNPILH